MEVTDATKFKHSAEEEDKLKKLDWSQEKLPKEEEQDEEEKLTEE